MQKFYSFISFSLAILFLIPFTSEGKSLRVYLIGNSLTDNIDHAGLTQLAEYRNHDHTHGSHRIPGAPMGWLYDHPDHGFYHRPYGRWGKAFGNYQWDAVSLQPFTRKLDPHLEAAQNFMDTIKVLSPDAQIYIYAQWSKEGNGDYARQWLRDVRPFIEGTGSVGPGAVRTKMYFETLVDTLTKLRPDMKPLKISPVGHVFYLMDQKIKAGMVPGHTSIWDFVVGTHVNNVGSYIAGLTYFATLYQESPVGLPVVEPYQAEPGSKYDLPISNELATIIQESVWEIVATHPQTGVTTDDPVRVVSPIIENAIENNEYNFVFLPAFGKMPYTWEVTSGSLPEGLSLSESGKITGITNEVGDYTFSVKVTGNNGTTDEKEYTLTVENDTEPVITTGTIPNAPLGSYYKQKLEIEGGNGTILWEIEEGELPPVMELTQDGTLKGAPGVKGSYTFTVKATDADLSNPDEATKTLTLSVGPATEYVIYAPKVLRDSMNPNDGKLDESVWDLSNTASKLVMGDAHNNNVTFDIVWSEHASNGGIYVGIKIEDTEITDGDAVEVYIDALNNKEETYNWDDRRVVVNAKGELVESVGDMSRNKANGSQTQDGYVVEVFFNWRNLGLRREEKLNRVVGIDIMNIDVDENGDTTKVVWKGSINNPTDPSEFGPVIMVEEPTGIGHYQTDNMVTGNNFSNVHIFRNGAGHVCARLPNDRTYNVSLFNLNGAEIASKTIKGLNVLHFTNVKGSTVYIVRIKSGNRMVNRIVPIYR